MEFDSQRQTAQKPVPNYTGSAGSIALTIAALYFGRDIFVPIAIAILLSFVLAPGVRFLRGLHLGRVAPVLAMTLLAMIVMAGIGTLIAVQVRDLTTDLPQYQDTIRRKLDTLRSVTSDSHLKRITDFITSLSNDPGHKAEIAPGPSGLPVGGPKSEPMTVVVQTAEPTTFDLIGSVLAPLIHPLATAGIVVIFTIFVLLQREDLRNRMIRLVGAGDLHRSTAAIDDAARRLSRLLLSQLALNTGAGILIGAALWLIGVPSPVLSGILFACLRFVPYLGPPLATLLPIGLAAAVDPGWSMVLWTVCAFAVLELLLGQVIEPVLYGHNTGLSPVAVVLSATFWTALWGPIGLLLSTPVTVCVVVLGRHIEHLQLFDLLLGDRPPLEPPEVFYQRMLANDPVEAAEQARGLLSDSSLTDYYDSVVLPGLLLGQDDVAQGRLDIDHQRRIASATADLAEDLSDADPDREAPTKPSLMDKFTARDDAAAPTILERLPTHELAAEFTEPGSVLCIGARGPLDDAAALLMAQLLAKHGFGTATGSYEVLLNAHARDESFAKARLVALSCLDGNSTAYLRFIMRRLRRRTPTATVLICSWWRCIEGHAPAPDAGLSEGQASRLSEAVAFCVGQASADRSGSEPKDERLAAPEPVAG